MKQYQNGSSSNVVGFNTEADMEEFYLANHKMVWAALVFNSTSNTSLSYAIRLPADKIPSTTDLMGDVTISFLCRFTHPCKGFLYFATGFLSLQHFVDISFTEMMYGNGSSILVNVTQAPFPPPDNQFDLSAAEARRVFVTPAGGVWICVALMIPVFMMVTEFVAEKENKIREEMKMMGLRCLQFFFVA
jgi:hypothetical protein